MCANHEKERGSHEYHNLTPVAWSILVMGLSLAAVILLWIWFGHIGPSFSSDTLAEQQRILREQYNLPHEQIITDPKVLLTPPSLRNITNTSDTNSNKST
jgi:hypothetical protein